VRVRRTDQNAMKFAGQRDVGDEATLTAEEFRILDTPDRRADAFMREGGAWIYWYSSRNRSSRS
jgi:hypothetical protein